MSPLEKGWNLAKPYKTLHLNLRKPEFLEFLESIKRRACETQKNTNPGICEQIKSKFVFWAENEFFGSSGSVKICVFGLKMNFVGLYARVRAREFFDTIKRRSFPKPTKDVLADFKAEFER